VQRDRDDIRRSLLRKGFFSKEQAKHEYLRFYLNGKPTSVVTFLSRGSGYKTYASALLAEMAHQLHLTKQQLLDLIDCPLSEQDYTSLLQQQGILKAQLT
jgi:hypothetical protein